ncbi:uncharacterized protein MYCFIDRAFT_88754 [Pseudocercospora fijiensis CIRAD86]|uniref:RRM domain-containing protein n=1 Tax=Pseudocercospora fijiensis (strain CIRAD86) TaxID=383855 RepID=M3AL89_PSEFD|nr:uncharacterized protein MYCFIDRAFT_88754 [Pseudocercospora fijiensis CIRAD86]EME85336.1 hypothetical protein MYCFIDRAFT_88754 [Pseudocercospora fijiensis CIRAD86]
MAHDDLNRLVMTLLALSSGLEGTLASQIRTEIAKIPAALYSERNETDKSIAALKNQTREVEKMMENLRRENEHLKEAYTLLEMPMAHVQPELQTANTPHADTISARGFKGGSCPPSEERRPPEARASIRKRFSTGFHSNGDHESECNDRISGARDENILPTPSGKRVWVGGLARETDEGALREFFDDFECVSIAFHTTSSKNRIAFVILPTAAEASRAVRQLHNKRLLDRIVSVKHAIPKTNPSSEDADCSDVPGEGDFHFRGRSSTNAVELFPRLGARSQDNPAKRAKISPA